MSQDEPEPNQAEHCDDDANYSCVQLRIYGPLIRIVRNTIGSVRRPGRDDREAHHREDPHARQPPGGKEEREGSAAGIPIAIAHSSSHPRSLALSTRADNWAVRT